MFFGLGCAIIVLFLIVPLWARAHEVYVLPPLEAQNALAAPFLNPFTALQGQGLLFLGWGIFFLLAVIFVLRISVFKFLERACDPWLIRMKKYAPLAGRITIGVSLFASGYFGDLFGPELPFSQLFDGSVHLFSLLLMAVGLCLIFGVITRIAALIGLLFFGFALLVFHGYMLTYANYLGELLLVLLLGGSLWSVDHLMKKSTTHRFAHLERYSFLILRICYGAAIFFASFYAKFLHSNLALQTVNDYHLTDYFHFTPLFLVMGAFLVEAFLGIFFAIGFEIRFAAIVFTCFLALSLWFFGETVWPHLILFGVNATLFLHGYDEYTVEKWLVRINKREEPVL